MKQITLLAGALLIYLAASGKLIEIIRAVQSSQAAQK